MNDEIFELLRRHRSVGQIARAELEWIAAHATLERYKVGEIVSRRTEPVAGLYILTAGRMAIHVQRPGSPPRRVMEWKAGDVTGMLPYSRMVNPPGDIEVEEPIEAVFIRREELPDLARNCYELTSILVHEMTDRARHFTVTDLRDEKLTSLGKLAAGLAHELNNPASALIRDAKTLDDHLTMAQNAARSLWGADLDSKDLAALDEFLSSTQDEAGLGISSSLDIADREDAFDRWLADHGLDASLAADLARSPVSDQALNRLAGSLPAQNLEAALRWFVGAHGARSLLLNIVLAASRIHSLVGAVKGFTHLDRGAVEEPVDVSAGLTDTLALLSGKARDRSLVVDLVLPPDLPRIRGRVAEVNQIWMNLLDNAIHAASHGGRVGVSAAREGNRLLVSVVNDGPGIPADVGGRIFEPFFTTKDVGEGSGLGLDIVRRIVHLHHGEIDFDSHPGRTEFRVRLPLD